MNKTLSLLTVLWMSFLLTAAYGQLPNCIFFSNLEEGAAYEEPEAVFYRERDVDLSLDSFYYVNGGIDLGYVEAGESFFEPLNWPGEGMHLFISNANVVFDFSDYPGGVNFLCVNFYDGGGQVNVNVNGVWQTFEDFPQDGWVFSDGIFIDIGNNTLCVNADVPITEFAIGGQEFIIDNACFSPLPSPPGCLTLDDESALFEEAAAQFFPNGLPYYSEDGVIFSLNRTFTNLQGITPNGHVLRPEAASFPVFSSASGLFLQHILSLSNIDLTAWVQAGQAVSFDYFMGSIAATVPPPNDFYIKINNTDIRLTSTSANQTFSLGNFIVSVNLLPGQPGNGRVTISPLTPTGRIERLVVGGPALAIDNLCSANCAIGQAEAVQYVCDGDHSALTVGYSGDLPGNSLVQIFLNDTLYTGPNNTNSFLASSFPRRIVLPLHYGVGDTVRVRLQSLTFEECSTDEFSLVLVGCEAVCEGFSVTPLSAALVVNATLDVEFTTTAQPTGQLIRVRQLGANAQGGVTYVPPAGPLGVSVPVASSELLNPYTLVFEDGSTGCRDTVSLEAVYDCVIQDFLVEVECRPDGSFFIDLNLFYDSPAPDLTFVAYVGDEAFEFGIDELPVRLGPFEPVNAGVTLTVTDAGGLCNTQTIFIPYNCGTCPLQNATAQVVECLNTGYQASLITQLLATTPNTFVRIRSTVSNTVVELPYLPQLLVNMPYTGLTYDRWEVCIDGFPDCCRIVEFSLAACQQQQCDITSINGELGCDPDGSGHRLFLNFDVIQPGNDFFDLFINGQPRGFYPLSELPLVLNDVELPANAQTAVIRVCINDMPDCCAEFVVDVPGCNNQTCGFNDLIVEPYACDGDQFMVDVAFSNPAPGALGFYIFADGNINGPFAYGQSFYTVGPLNGNNANHTFLLLDIANPACYASSSLTYSCSDDCVITAVNAEVQPCEDGFFSVTLNVEANNEGESFIVVGNGNNYGVFNYADLPITLGPFNGEDGPDVYEFGVTDLQNPGCTNWTAIDAPNCAPCSISNLSVEVNCDASNTGEPTITVNFDYENPASDLFALVLNGVVYEWFPYSTLPLTRAVPADLLGGDVVVVGVHDVQQESCGQTIELEIPCCTFNWPATDVRVEACAEDGTFGIWVVGGNSAEYGFNLSDSLVITYAPAGATLIETIVIAYSDLPVLLGPLNGNGLTPYYITLTDQLRGCTHAVGLSPIACDDVNCVEFSDLDGIYGPASGEEPGDVIYLENGVTFTYEVLPVPITIPPLGNIFGVPNSALPAANGFGEGQIMSLQNAAFGVDFSQAAEFTGFQVQFYHAGGAVALSVNGGATHFVPTLSQLPAEPAPGVTLSVLFSNAASTQGILRMEGPVETVRLYTLQTSAWDELCMDWVDEPVNTQCLTFEGIEGHIDSTNLVAFNDTNTDIFYEEGLVSISTAPYLDHLGQAIYGNLALVTGSQNSNDNALLAVNRNVVFDFPALSATGRISLRVRTSYGVNMGFNNQAPVFYERFSNIPEMPIPGIQVTVLTTFNPGGQEEGVIIVEGDLTALTIGGGGLFIWEICLDYVPGHEEVWPGDANLDNQANHFDLLNVGLAYEAVGPARNSGSTAWNAQSAQPWNSLFADGVNFKHADCNGDGLVDATDREVILDNYALTHGPITPFEPLPATSLDPPVFIGTGEVDTLPSGVVFEIPIHIGEANQPVENIYGLAFEVTLDPNLVNLEDLELVVPASWLGEPGVNLLHLNYRYNSEGKLEIALVRTDHNNVSGYGPVAYLRGIIDDIVGIEQTAIGIEKIKAINAEGAGIPLRNLQTMLVLTSLDGHIDGQVLESSFGVFPNPTQGMVHFRNAYDLPAERIEIYDAAGRMVSDQRGVFHQLSVTNLPTGIYMLQFQVGGYRFCRRLVKID